MFQSQDLNSFYRYARALLHDEVRAFDCVQSAVVKVLEKDPENPRAYARTVIRNLAFDELRRNQRWKEEPLDFDKTEPDLFSVERDLETLTIEKEQVLLILDRLSAEERELLFLWAVEEMTFSEISQKLDIKRGTLLSRMYRLKNKLKKKEAEDESAS